MNKSGRTAKRLPVYTDERGREYFFDNAKFLLMICVVMAHAVAPLKDGHDSAKALWILFNSFHMACFVFISGYFSKSYIDAKGKVKIQRLFTYVMYYLFSQAFMILFRHYVLGTSLKELKFGILQPQPALWYLVCMIIWLVVLPYVSKLKVPFAIIGAFVCGLLIGYDQKAGGVLSICRAVTHFPFFMIGYYFDKDWLFKFRNKWTKLLSLAIFAGALVFAFFNYDIIATKVLECAYNYRSSDLKIFTAEPFRWVNRLVFYAVAAVLCAAFLTLVPRRKTFFTKFGSRTLQIYIIHRLLYFCEEEWGWYKLPFFDTYGVWKMAAVSVIVTFILALKPFEYPFKLISKTKIDPLLKHMHRSDKKQS